MRDTYEELGLYYGMDGQKLTREEWIKVFEDPNGRRVALDVLPNGFKVSTVLLGIDHSFGFGGPPVIFETMVFPGNDMERYSTKEEALEGHKRMVEKYCNAKPGEVQND